MDTATTEAPPTPQPPTVDGPDSRLPEMTGWSILLIGFALTPFGGFALLLIAIPALMRLFALTHDRPDHQLFRPIRFANYASAFGLALVILFASGILFVAVCFPLGVAAVASDLPHRDSGLSAALMALAFGLGFAVAASAAYGVVRLMFGSSSWSVREEAKPDDPVLTHHLDPWEPWRTAWVVIVMSVLLIPWGGLLVLVSSMPTVIRLFAISGKRRRWGLSLSPDSSWLTALLLGSVLVLIGLMALHVLAALIPGRLTSGEYGSGFAGAAIFCVVLTMVACGYLASLFVRVVFEHPRRNHAAAVSRAVTHTLREKFGEQATSFAVELQNQNPEKLEAVLDALDTTRDLDDLRKLL